MVDIDRSLFHIAFVKVVFWLLLVFALPTMMTAEVGDREYFPAEAHGWTLAPGSEDYTPEDLYKYIDGASELYISYGFKTLSTRRYERAGWPEITVDLFDMGAPGNAFGIFAHSQENPGREVGQDSEYLDGLLRFWQGGHYAAILCSPETPESQTAVMALGRQMAKRLPPAGSRPAALALLPEQGLIASSIRYFRHPAWQNTYVFISSENILNIGPESEAILAKYDQGEQKPVVLLVLYPDSLAAGRAFADLSRVFHLPLDGGAAVQLADKKYFAAGSGNGVVVAVWHGGGAAQALALLAALRANIPPIRK
jgi:hypothetical protein